jgi:hypothetical protein
MLPPEIVRKITEKFGREIRYSSDVDELVDDIKRTTHESIGSQHCQTSAWNDKREMCTSMLHQVHYCPLCWLRQLG